MSLGLPHRGDLHDGDSGDRASTDSPDDDQPDQAQERVQHPPPAAAGLDESEQGRRQQPERLREPEMKPRHGLPGPEVWLDAGSSTVIDGANRSGVVSAAAGTSRSSSVQPGWSSARPSAAMTSFLRSNACRIAPTSRNAGNNRVKERRSGIETSSGTSSSRCPRDRQSRGLVVANHVVRPLSDQGTTQVKTVASPRGAISHWSERRGEQQGLAEVERHAIPSRARRSTSPSNPSRS